MAGLVSLLGDALVTKSGEKVKTESLCAPGKVVALYFSAHWCPPCRGFTPTLVEWYNNFKKGTSGDKLEMVFVSSDRSEEDFKSYFAEMPWHALPYDERDRKAKVSKKFKVSGIPTLVFLEADTGNLITSNGREKLTNDPDGKDFPWYPKPLGDLLKGPLVGKDGETDFETAASGKVIGIYFSAHWCPPCRGFTPQLVDVYKKIKGANKNFEIIFASSDRTESAFQEYFGEMPWLSIPFGDKRKDELSSHFEIEGIPSLVILDEDRKVITTNGRAAVGSDLDGKEFPWHPKPLNALTGSSVSLVNDSPCLLYFVEEDKSVDEVTSLLWPIAEEHHKSGNDPELMFFYAKDTGDDDIIDSIRDFANLEHRVPMIVILDIPETRIYVHPEGSLTSEDIQNIVTSFKAEKLQFKPLRG